MARAMWSGSISFGLVNIPVKVYPATRSMDIHFHQIHEKSKCRVHHKLFCPEVGEVPSDEVVKGYEVAPDQYVIVKKEELDALAPEQTETIEITDFVDLASVDPIYYDKPYYLLPDERAAKAYRLLATAMTKSGKVAIAKVVMRNKEYLVALRPINDIICMELMRFADELVSVEDLEAVPKKSEVGEKELKMARQLIESLTTDFEPENYHNEYTEKVRALIDRKAQGEEIVTQPHAEDKRGKVIDLMAALEQSLTKIGKKKPRKPVAKSGSGKTRKSA
ncbi:MAG TPA: Ku protein [Desulfomonilaceae bacterium]|nr:Ku protein [Desulfomonilaceae bacterium]